MDASINHSAFFHSKYERAVALFESGNHAHADDVCLELISNFACPRLIQVHALQLRSLCTKNYWHARSYLLGCFEILGKMPDLYEDVNASDKVMVDMSNHTVMLAELESAWQKKWEKQGLPVPSEEPVEDHDDERKTVDDQRLSSAMEEMDIDTADKPSSTRTEETTAARTTHEPLTPPPTSPVLAPERREGEEQRMEEDL